MPSASRILRCEHRLDESSEMTTREHSSGVSFQVVFESSGAVSVVKCYGDAQSPWAIPRGVRDLAPVVLLEPICEVIREAGIMSSAVFLALQNINVAVFVFHGLQASSFASRRTKRRVLLKACLGVLSRRSPAGAKPEVRRGIAGPASSRSCGSELRRGNFRRKAKIGGANGIRTRDPHVANVVLYQLSYRPIRMEFKKRGV